VLVLEHFTPEPSHGNRVPQVLEVYDTAQSDPAFARTIELAIDTFEAYRCLITLRADAQYSSQRQVLARAQTSQPASSFWYHTMASAEPLVVLNTTIDERFC
jgi:hypothetical protein